MSKISEQKALEEYPEKWYCDCDGDSWDANNKLRKGYIKGYDQAMQDFLEKTEKWFEDNFSIMQGIPEYFVVKEFKNYMQNE